MGERKSVRITGEQDAAIDDLQDRDKAESESEALRMLITAGMRHYGYRATGNGNTSLKWLSGELARLFAYIGLGWLAFFWAFPVKFRVLGAVVLVMALGMVAVYAVLDQVEPAVSERLFGESDTA